MAILFEKAARIAKAEKTDSAGFLSLLECEGDVWHVFRHLAAMGWSADRIRQAMGDNDFYQEQRETIEEIATLPEKSVAYTTRGLTVYGAGGLDHGSGKAVVFGSPNKALQVDSLVRGLILLFADCLHYGGEVGICHGMEARFPAGIMEAAKAAAEKVGFNQAPSTVFYKQYRED